MAGIHRLDIDENNRTTSADEHSLPATQVVSPDVTAPSVSRGTSSSSG